MSSMAIGVTAWSLQIPETKFREVLRTIKEDLQLRLIQIGAFGRLELTEKVREEWLKAIRDYDMQISATCVAFIGEDYSSLATARATVGFVDPECVEPRLRHMQDMAELTAELGVGLLTTHMGYIHPDSSHPEYRHLLDVTRRAADMLGKWGIALGLEVGGLETAKDLLSFVQAVERDNVKINFDPANLVRAGMGDPIQALDVLGGHVAHVHCKDATYPRAEGQWGEDVPLGEGEVNFGRFVQKLKEIGYQGPLMVENEGRDMGIEDVRIGLKLLRGLV